MRKKCLIELYPILTDDQPERNAMRKLAWKYGVEREVMLKWIQHKNAVEWIEQQYDFNELQQSCVDYQSRKGPIGQTKQTATALIQEHELDRDWMDCIKAVEFTRIKAHYWSIWARQRLSITRN